MVEFCPLLLCHWTDRVHLNDLSALAILVLSSGNEDISEIACVITGLSSMESQMEICIKESGFRKQRGNVRQSAPSPQQGLP